MLKVEAPGGAREILLHACCAPCSGAVLECLRDSGIRPVVFFSNSNIYPRAEYELRLSELRRYAGVMGVELVEDAYDHEAWLAAVRGLEDEPERGRRCEACFRFRLGRAAQFAASRGLGVLATTLASSRWKDLDQVNAAGESACLSIAASLRGSRLRPDEAAAVSTSPAIAVAPGQVERSEVRISGPAGPGTFVQQKSERALRPQGVAGGGAPLISSSVAYWPQNWRKGGLQERRNAVIREQGFYNQTWCGCEFSKSQNPLIQ